MSAKRSAKRRFKPGDAVIVEVEGFEGEDGEIVVENWRADRKGDGLSHILYCIAALGEDGVVRFDDWGYATAEEAKEALAGRRRAEAHDAADGG
jgi:hypothetical protein